MAKFVAVNWRDLRNPEAGGAEVHLHEILRRMVERGHEVTLFATAFPGGSGEEHYDGIQVIRRGNWKTANYVLPRHVRNYVRSRGCDLVIDDINKIPFFLPTVVDVPVLPVIPHLFGTTVFRETNFLLAAYVYFWEFFIPRVYRKCRFAVISPSTKDDLIRRGIPADRIDVVLCGLDHQTYRVRPGLHRFDRPTLIHFGRVRKYKSIDVVIRAFALIRERLPDAELLIVGDGPELPALVALAGRLGLGNAVRFLGVVPTPELVELLNQVHLFLNASPKEGWGLTVVEANACGVPVVASDRPGLRDSVQHGGTGYLVPYGDVRAFADRSLELLSEKDRWHAMSEAALAWARSLTWDRTADEMERVFDRVIASKRGGRVA